MKRVSVDELSAIPFESGDGDSDAAFLKRLGQQVRRSRAVRGMSRKTLARLSGISERYIAQLESGAGNVSIILLRRVAAATGCRLEDLIVEDGHDTEAWAAVRTLLREATPTQVDQIKSTLLGGAGSARPAPGGDRAALIGLRGAGKSTLGAAAAERLGRPFVELNKDIETDSGFSVAEIFSIYGQEGYRRFERDSLRRVIARPGPMILATGGGIVAEAATFDLLLSSFFTVWVKATPTEHMSRVRRQGDLRPMAKDRAAMEELETILSTREPLYARAEAVLDTSGGGVEASVEGAGSIGHGGKREESRRRNPRANQLVSSAGRTMLIFVFQHAREVSEEGIGDDTESGKSALLAFPITAGMACFQSVIERINAPRPSATEATIPRKSLVVPRIQAIRAFVPTAGRNSYLCRKLNLRRSKSIQNVRYHRKKSVNVQ